MAGAHYDLVMTGTEADLDELLRSERPLSELKPFFRNLEAVLECHARTMSQLFAARKCFLQCACCEKRPADRTLAFRWRGIYHTTATVVGTLAGILLATGGHGVLPHKQIEFETIHGLCKRCLRRIRLRRFVGGLAEKLCFALIIISALLLVPMLVFAPVILFPHPTLRAILIVSLSIVLGCGGLVGGLSGAKRIAQWGVPKGLKVISKPPFQLAGLAEHRCE